MSTSANTHIIILWFIIMEQPYSQRKMCFLTENDLQICTISWKVYKKFSKISQKWAISRARNHEFYGTVGKQVYCDQLYFVDFVLSRFTINYKKWSYVILRVLYACYSATFFMRCLNDIVSLFRWAVLDFDPTLAHLRRLYDGGYETRTICW